MGTRRISAIVATALVALLAAGCASEELASRDAAPPSAGESAQPGRPADDAVQSPFGTSDYTPLPVRQRPYEVTRLVDVTDAARHPVDKGGVAVYVAKSGEQLNHPVVLTQYGISALSEYRETGEPVWLERAAANANRLLEIAVERDRALFFPYEFDWTYYDRTLSAPWFSGMAQGQALSLFSRLSEEQPGEARWRDAADQTWASFEQKRSESEPWTTLIDRGNLWFEEYAGDQPPLLVLNGHIFAIFGLYDYFSIRKQDATVAEYFDGATTTVLANMALIRKAGGLSYYCAQADYCRSDLWQNSKYHGIHQDQLRMLGEMTGSKEFGEWADTLEADLAVP